MWSDYLVHLTNYEFFSKKKMSKQQKPWGVKRLLADENVKVDRDLYDRHMERKAKLKRRSYDEDKKLAAIMFDLNVCSGGVNATVE